MARKEKFVLVSLQEDKAKKLSQVMSNDSCRKILDYLAEKDATETELSSVLQIPLSTVHYNLKILMESGLAICDEYHYSPKGKEVNHYKLANQYIIITPKSTFGLKDKLRSILPVALIAGGTAALLQIFSRMQGSIGSFAMKAAPVQEASADLVQQASMKVSEEAASAAPSLMKAAGEEALRSGAPAISQAASIVAEPSLWSSIALWFFIGAVFAIVLYLVVERIRKR